MTDTIQRNTVMPCLGLHGTKPEILTIRTWHLMYFFNFQMQFLNLKSLIDKSVFYFKPITRETKIKLINTNTWV